MTKATVRPPASSLSESLAEMNLEKAPKQPFDTQRFLSGPDYRVKVPIINIHNEVVSHHEILVSRQRVLEARDRLYKQWVEEERQDLRGVLCTALGQVFKEAIKEYISNPANLVKKPKKVAAPALVSRKSYVVKPL